jgi:tRNA nucleotidyltransferase (CCA-adding enzyme)
MSLDLSTIPFPLLAAVKSIAEAVKEAGGRSLMVGGAVRDLMLGGREVKDVDLEVYGLDPERLQRVVGERFAFDECGLSFGVMKIRHFDIDVSLPRRESKRGIGHKGFLVDSDPFLSIPEAASRRDFTVNAMYYDPLADAFEDPYGGVDDLKRRVLRHVSSKFVEDPLRVLRGMQFIARFGLHPAPETVEICRTVTMEDLPPERLFEEWSKMLVKGVHIGRGLAFLRAAGWVRYFPELQHLIGCEQDPKWHPEGDVWNHTCLCLDAFAKRRDEMPSHSADEDLIVGLAVLCHDFGKPATTRWVRGRLRSLGHDVAGVGPTLSFLRRLTNEERILREVPPLVSHHMQPFSLWKAHAGDAAVRRLAREVKRLDRLIRVARADDEGRTIERLGGSSEGQDLKWLEETAERLRVADSAPKPILMGRDLLAMGYKPSPQIGKWLDACFEAQLDGAFGDRVGAIEYFRTKIEGRNI